jgi:hypothetical protein
MSGRTRLSVACVIVAALALALTGCSAIAERATKSVVEKATGVKVDENGGSVTVTGKDGKTATFSSSDKQLPEGLPADFPVYEGEPDASAKAEAPEGVTFSFTIRTADDVKTVFDWYKGKLTDGGWTIENATSAEYDGKQSGTISAKKDKEQSVVTVGPSSKEDGRTDVTVILNVKN